MPPPCAIASSPQSRPSWPAGATWQIRLRRCLSPGGQPGRAANWWWLSVDFIGSGRADQHEETEPLGRELTNQFYALYADIRQRVLTRLCRENAAVAPPEILRCTQKLLDRVLSCTFCEDRGLFRAIEEGNPSLNIPAYNGGLFAPDPALDPLQVPDEVCAHFKDLGDYDYRPAREVADAAQTAAVRSVIDVDILGHIFEQSITDLERLRQNLDLRGPTRVAADVSRRHIPGAQSAPTDVGGCTPSADRAECETSGPEATGGAADTAQPGRRRKQEGAVYRRALRF
jgi:hypothetical protein